MMSTKVKNTIEAENAGLREARQVEGPGESGFRPEMWADPFLDPPGEHKAYAEVRLLEAYVRQQKCVPDQMALVRRRDLGTTRHDLLRQRALADLYREHNSRAEFLLALMAACAEGKFTGKDGVKWQYVRDGEVSELRRQIYNLEAAAGDRMKEWERYRKALEEIAGLLEQIQSGRASVEWEGVSPILNRARQALSGEAASWRS